MNNLYELKREAVMVNDLSGIRGILNKLYRYRISADELKYYETVEDVTDILIMKCAKIIKTGLAYFPSVADLYDKCQLVDMLTMVKECAESTDVNLIYHTMVDINFTSAYLQTKLHRRK